MPPRRALDDEIDDGGKRGSKKERKCRRRPHWREIDGTRLGHVLGRWTSRGEPAVHPTRQRTMPPRQRSNFLFDDHVREEEGQGPGEGDVGCEGEPVVTLGHTIASPFSRLAVSRSNLSLSSLLSTLRVSSLAFDIRLSLFPAFSCFLDQHADDDDSKNGEKSVGYKARQRTVTPVWAAAEASTASKTPATYMAMRAERGEKERLQERTRKQATDQGRKLAACSFPLVLSRKTPLLPSDLYRCRLSSGVASFSMAATGDEARAGHLVVHVTRDVPVTPQQAFEVFIQRVWLGGGGLGVPTIEVR